MLNQIKSIFLKITSNDSNVKQTHVQQHSQLHNICMVLSRIVKAQLTAGANNGTQRASFKVESLGREFVLVLPAPMGKLIAAESDINLGSIVDRLTNKMKVIYKKADPATLINNMLPQGVICTDVRIVAAAFWLWLCITDG